MTRGMKTAAITTALLGLAHAANAQSTEYLVELYGAQSESEYLDDLNPFIGFGGSVTMVTQTADGAPLQLELAHRDTPPEGEDDYDFTITTASMHYGIDIIPGDGAVFGGVVTTEGYDSGPNDGFWMAGVHSRFSPASSLTVDVQGGMLYWFAGEYEPEDPELLFANLRGDYAITDRFGVSAELGLIDSIGDIGDSSGESLTATTFGLGIEMAVTETVTGFGRYADFTGGWGDLPDDEFGTATVSIGAEISLGGNAGTAKRNLMNFEAIPFIRQDGW